MPVLGSRAYCMQADVRTGSQRRQRHQRENLMAVIIEELLLFAFCFSAAAVHSNKLHRSDEMIGSRAVEGSTKIT